MERISIVGLGRMGGALAIALSRSGYEIADLVVRQAESADRVLPHLAVKPTVKILGTPVDGDIVIIAASDPAIAECSQIISENLTNRPVVLHTSGSLSSTVLSACEVIGCATGSMHPLVSVSDPEAGSRNFAGKYFCLEGSESAAAAARSLVNSLGGNAFSIETKFKALYHAAAVTSAGHIVALFGTAVQMLSKCGVDEAEAHDILFPLLQSTVENLRTRTPAEALTGSFARLDIEAFERHLAAFEGSIPEDIQQLFLLLGERSIDLIENARADSDSIAEFRRRINMAKRGLEC